MKLEFLLTDFQLQIKQNFTKIRPIRAEFLHKEGQTDMTKQVVAFHNYGNARKKT